MPRPALGPVKVGDTLIVIPKNYGRGPDRPAEAVVTKVGRVWIEMERSDGNGFRPTTWRLRLDTQDDGSDGNYRDRFLTPAQHAWQQRVDEAQRVLAASQLPLQWPSRWFRDEDRLFALAEFVRAYDAEHPA